MDAAVRPAPLLIDEAEIEAEIAPSEARARLGLSLEPQAE